MEFIIRMPDVYVDEIKSNGESTSKLIVRDNKTKKTILLNESTASILLLCDGRTEEEIYREYVTKWESSGVEKATLYSDAQKILSDLLKLEIVAKCNTL